MESYIIIGGSSGIGKVLTMRLAEKGKRVFATYNNTPAQNTERVSYQKLNVLDEQIQLSLPDSIQGLAYCVGSINLKPFHRIKAQDFVDDFNLQLTGAVKVIQAVLPKMAQGASIVLFSTIAVQKGFTFHAQVSASKGAIEGLTRALAAELAPKIRVNAVAPSLTDTPLAQKLLSSPEKIKAQADKNPLKRIGTPQDIAKAAVYLLTDESSWVTGQVLHIDGGFSVL